MIQILGTVFLTLRISRRYNLWNFKSFSPNCNLKLQASHGLTISFGFWAQIFIFSASGLHQGPAHETCPLVLFYKSIHSHKTYVTLADVKTVEVERRSGSDLRSNSKKTNVDCILENDISLFYPHRHSCTQTFSILLLSHHLPLLEAMEQILKPTASSCAFPLLWKLGIICPHAFEGITGLPKFASNHFLKTKQSSSQHDLLCLLFKEQYFLHLVSDIIIWCAFNTVACKRKATYHTG